MKFIIGVQNTGDSIKDNKVEICEICRKKLSNDNPNIDFRIVMIGRTSEFNKPDDSILSEINKLTNNVIKTAKQSDDEKTIGVQLSDNEKTKIAVQVVKQLILLSANYPALCHKTEQTINKMFEQLKTRANIDKNIFIFGEKERNKIVKILQNKFTSDTGLTELQVLFENITGTQKVDFNKLQIALTRFYQNELSGAEPLDFTKEKLNEYLKNKTVEGTDKVVIYICPESDPEKVKFKEYIDKPSSFVAENNDIYHALFHSTEVAFWVHQSKEQSPNKTLVYVPDRPPHPFELKFKTVNRSTSQ